MSGKSWFSLSSWYGSGSQEEGASTEGKEEGAKAEESKGERNGEAGARGGSGGASSSEEHKRHERHGRHGDHGHHGHRKKHKSGNEDDGEVKYPAVDTYGPCTIKGSDLIPGKRMKWCTCGLSLKAPWCDGRHKKTGFKSLKWEVPEEPQSVYQFCNCQYTKTPPFCDGTHTNLPEVIEAQEKNCPHRDSHADCQKLCTGCGFKVDF